MNEETPLIHARNLTKVFQTFAHREGVWGAVRDLFQREYEAVRAVDGIDLSIARGEIVGYIGPNGAGKSTTVKMLAGILVPTEGSVEVAGFVPWRDRKAYTRRIGVVFGQRSSLWWDIAVIESLRLLQKIYGVSEADFEKRVAWFDDVLELRRYLDTPARKLSLGQRMRSELAAALIHNPDVVFLDEPTIGLDVAVKARIRDFLRAVNRESDTTILLTTHDIDDIEALARRVLVIDEGCLIYDGALAGLKAKLGATRQLRVTSEEDDLDAFRRATDDLDVAWQRDEDGAFSAGFDAEAVRVATLLERVLGAGGRAVSDVQVTDASIAQVVREMYERRRPGERADPQAQQQEQEAS